LNSCRWRAQAAAAGRVPPVPDIPALTTDLLNAFLGTTVDPPPVAISSCLTPHALSLQPNPVVADLLTEPLVIIACFQPGHPLENATKEALKFSADASTPNSVTLDFLTTSENR
jgi:hypothetical protein